jgi:Siphovirus ReqiPepy6 Gp37-like protein
MTILAPYSVDTQIGTAWILQAADGTTPTAAIDVYESATITARFNAVSSWELTLPTQSDGAQALLTAARPRVVFSSQVAEVFRSGPPIDYTRTIDDNGDFMTITGVDDLAWLARRVAHPQPGTAAPPYSSTAYDTRTGPVSQVIAAYVNANAGPGAVVARQVPDFVVPTPAAMGPTITRKLRYHNLLEMMARMADGAGLGIEVVDMTFNVFTPTGSARFSVELGTLASSESSATAPEGNHIYLAGSGEGTARLIVEVEDTESVAQWGRFETFDDQRNESSGSELATIGAESLAEMVTPPVVSMEAVNTEGQRFGVDWGLGSVATVWLDPDDPPFEQVIREVVVELAGNTPAVIRPTLGGTVDMALWRRLARTDTRIRQLEAR